MVGKRKTKTDKKRQTQLLDNTKLTSHNLPLLLSPQEGIFATLLLNKTTSLFS